MPTDAPPLGKTPDGSMAESQLQTIVGYQLAQASVVTDAFFNEVVRKPFDLRMLEFTVLCLVCENAGVSPLQLAASLAVTGASISTHVDRLVERGLVVRERSEQDGRRQHLHPTAAGRQLKRDATAAVIARERYGIDTLSSGEHRILLELLHKLASARRSGEPD